MPKYLHQIELDTNNIIKNIYKVLKKQKTTLIPSLELGIEKCILKKVDQEITFTPSSKPGIEKYISRGVDWEITFTPFLELGIEKYILKEVDQEALYFCKVAQPKLFIEVSSELLNYT